MTGLAGWWRLDGGTSGSIANNTTAGLTDSSGRGNNCTAINANGTGMAWAQGRLDGAVSFDGVDDHINCGNILNPGMGDFTISLWMKTTDSDQWISVLKKDGGGANYLFQLGSGWNGNCLFWFQDEARNQSSYAYAGYVATDGSWHHLVAVLSRSQQTLETYSDGSLWMTRSLAVGSGNLNGSISNNASLYIGNSVFNGSLDDVRIYNRALSATDVTELYNNGGPTTLRNAVIRNAVIR